MKILHHDAQIIFKLPQALKRSVIAKAKAKNMDLSEYLRWLIAKDAK